MAHDLHAGASEIESVIAVYLVAYATLIITGGRLGDIHGIKLMFVLGIASFTLASLWCGLAWSGTELIIARLAQGATAALMVPQVLATRKESQLRCGLPKSDIVYAHGPATLLWLTRKL